MASRPALDPAGPSAAPQPRRPGRPRRPDVEQVVLDAAIELLTERGVDGTTMAAVIERSGFARATVFLRWPSRRALITDAVRRAMGHPVLEGSGDLESDLRRGAAQIQDVLGSATFQRIFPAVVAGLLGPDDDLDRLSFDELAPGRAVIADEYRRLAVGHGFRADIDGDLVVDILIGAHIGYFLATGTPPSPEISERLLDVTINGLRERRQDLGSGT